MGAARKPFLLLVLPVAGLVLASVWVPAQWIGSGNAFLYDVAEVSKGPIRELVVTSAMRALVTVGVSSRLSERIRELKVDFNSEVKAGNELAVVTDKTFAAKVARRMPPGDDDTFVVRNWTESMKTRTAETTLGWLLGATAAIPLIVGGIGIMNIMLVSVTETTREIGVRMAVGAQRFDIMVQFLIAATTLCVLGRLIGVVLGVGAAFVTASLADWPILIAPQVVLVAIAATAATGILFGFLPSRRAALLNPIDALESE